MYNGYEGKAFSLCFHLQIAHTLTPRGIIDTCNKSSSVFQLHAVFKVRHVSQAC